MKIKEKETKLEKFICEKEKLIQKTRQHEIHGKTKKCMFRREKESEA